MHVRTTTGTCHKLAGIEIGNLYLFWLFEQAPVHRDEREKRSTHIDAGTSICHWNWAQLPQTPGQDLPISSCWL